VTVTDQGAPRRVPLSAERVRTTTFSRPPFGRRGFHEDEVRMFLNRVADDLAAADAEKAALRAEIGRLTNYYREHGQDPDAEAQRSRVSVEAVNLMSQAQQAADSHVAQAEEYARKLVAQARQRYEDLLQHAQDQAKQAASEAQRAADALPAHATEADRAALEQKVTYLRTFAEVTEVQLRSVLEALTREVDKLGDVPKP
jgi:cell division initiation protein